ncbi:hypothetical protein Y023_5587 [Burkholderia pseudomallei A79D]|nr:hypothetical protein Y023_5587 [Burkholderia pseudomallei A79D]KGX95714.1 hypothetical protein X997_5372 [Burkholderia pseudomallei A79C]
MVGAQFPIAVAIVLFFFFIVRFIIFPQPPIKPGVRSSQVTCQLSERTPAFPCRIRRRLGDAP